MRVMRKSTFYFALMLACMVGLLWQPAHTSTDVGYSDYHHMSVEKAFSVDMVKPESAVLSERISTVAPVELQLLATRLNKIDNEYAKAAGLFNPPTTKPAT
ncbi:MAG: hypothetical protein RIR39_1678, partial [Pseudomonadota bacterium]